MSQPTFDEDYYRARSDRVALWYYARVVRRLRPKGGRLLDFGCGTGHLLRRLASRFETYGYDVSDYARSEARKTTPRSTILDDWQTIPSSSLDVVTALHCLEHLEQPAPTLASLALRLTRGGLLFAVVPNPEGCGHRLKGRGWFGFRDPTHHSLLTQREWTDLLRGAGLEVARVTGDGLWDAPYVRFLPTLIQRPLFGAPAALQVFAPVARPFLPPVWGECLIFEAMRA